jgi:hypothetical protein
MVDAGAIGPAPNRAGPRGGLSPDASFSGGDGQVAPRIEDEQECFGAASNR